MKRILFALFAVMMVLGSALTTGCQKSADEPEAPAAGEQAEEPAEG